MSVDPILTAEQAESMRRTLRETPGILPRAYEEMCKALARYDAAVAAAGVEP